MSSEKFFPQNCHQKSSLNIFASCWMLIFCLTAKADCVDLDVPHQHYFSEDSNLSVILIWSHADSKNWQISLDFLFSYSNLVLIYSRSEFDKEFTQRSGSQFSSIWWSDSCYLIRVRISIYREIIIQMKVAFSSFHNCLKQLSYIILYRSLISYAQLYITELVIIFLFFKMKQITVFCASYAIVLKLQKNIKLSENIIVNLLTLSLKKNDLHQAESSSVCWQKSKKI